jgi:hypothetical protein
MPRDRSLTVQRTIYMTPEMWMCLSQLCLNRGGDCTENSLVREAIRAYLDDQVQVIGSRRHFQKTFQERIDALEAHISIESSLKAEHMVFYLHVVIPLLALGLAHLLHHITHTTITPQQLIQNAVIEARKEENVLAEQIQVVREMNMPERS